MDSNCCSASRPLGRHYQRGRQVSAGWSRHQGRRAERGRGPGWVSVDGPLRVSSSLSLCPVALLPSVWYPGEIRFQGPSKAAEGALEVAVLTLWGPLWVRYSVV